MRFIVDESTGIAVVEYLRNSGHDVLAVAEIMQQANDSDILTLALNEKRALITNDKDFGELVFRSSKIHHGVLLLRLHDESSTNRVRVVKSVFKPCGSTAQSFHRCCREPSTYSSCFVRQSPLTTHAYTTSANVLSVR